jgi:predicted transcriptional regulator
MVALTKTSMQESRRAIRRENRSRTNIIGDILGICKHSGPIKKTRLMQSVNLSSNMTNKYLEYMVERHLILRKERGYYAITQRGVRALHWYQRILELVSEERRILGRGWNFRIDM